MGPNKILVIPNHLVHEILITTHFKSLGDGLRTNRTFSGVAQIFYWVGLPETKQFVKAIAPPPCVTFCNSVFCLFRH